MKCLSKQSWLAWVLISAQMILGAIGYGRVVVCNDAGGPSHIELVRGEFVSHDAEQKLTSESCVQIVYQIANAGFGHCAGKQCVDQVLRLTCTINTQRKIGCGSLLDVVPTGPPAILAWPTPEPTLIAWVPCDGLNNDALVLSGLRRSVRSTVMNL